MGYLVPRRIQRAYGALIFLTAQEQGAVPISANGKDMEVLRRFGRGAQVLVYQPSPR